MRTLLLLVVVSLAGCGKSQEPCGPANCSGCCDERGQCLPGGAEDACGLKGAACQRCAPGLLCSWSTGKCGNCGPANCAGCCAGRSSDDCQPGNTTQSCGYGGFPCNTCGAGQACLNGFCQ